MTTYDDLPKCRRWRWRARRRLDAMVAYSPLPRDIYGLMQRRRNVVDAFGAAMLTPTRFTPMKVRRRIKRAWALYRDGSALNNRCLEIAESALRDGGYLA